MKALAIPSAIRPWDAAMGLRVSRTHVIRFASILRLARRALVAPAERAEQEAPAERVVPQEVQVAVAQAVPFVRDPAERAVQVEVPRMGAPREVPFVQGSAVPEAPDPSVQTTLA
jgi:hypothetical protein